MLTSGTDPKGLKEYDGQIEVKVCYAIHIRGGKIRYRKGVGVHREDWAEPLLKGTRISFCGRGSERGSNSEATS